MLMQQSYHLMSFESSLLCFDAPFLYADLFDKEYYNFSKINLIIINKPQKSSFYGTKSRAK